MDPANARGNEEATRNCCEGVAGHCNRDGIPEWLEDFTENLEIVETLAAAGISHDTDPERPKKSGIKEAQYFYSLPKDRNCEVCKRTKIIRASCRRRTGETVLRAEKFGDFDYSRSQSPQPRNNHRYAVVAQDLATQWRRKGVYDSFSSRLKSRKSFILTIHWNLANLVKLYHGIIVSLAWMKNGGLILWNAIAICERSKTSWRIGKRLMKHDSENHLKARSFRSEQRLNIFRSLQKTSRGSTTLVRNSCQEYSSNPHWLRGELGEMYWLPTWRSWDIGRVRNPCSKAQCKRNNVPKRSGQHFLNSCSQMEQQNCVEEFMKSKNQLQLARSEDLRREFLGNSDGSQPTEAHDDVGPRVELYLPKEETLPIPLKYIDVTRTAHTSLDVLQEKRFNDYWNVDVDRTLSDSWTGFTKST